SATWLAVIVLESTNLGSAEHTSRILYPIFHLLFGMDLARFAAWHAVLRKTGHFVGYFTLSVLLFRSWRATFPRLSTRWCLQWASVAFLSTSLVAMLDEWHQSFLNSRTGTLRDVLSMAVPPLPHKSRCSRFCKRKVLRNVDRASRTLLAHTFPRLSGSNLIYI